MRKLGLIIAFWAVSIALPLNAFALGLGEIEVDSFLNQPLKAEIQVISARTGEIDDLLVSLASRDSFTRAGLSRPANLSELRFLVQKNEEGDKAVILITTRSAIKEPFLNFLVEADWAKGRLLKEYTVLLDPPFYSEIAVPTEPTAILQTEPVLQPTPIASDSDSLSVEPVDLQTAAELLATSGPDSVIEPIALAEPVEITELEDTSDATEIIEPVAIIDTELTSEISSDASEDLYVAKDVGVTFDGEVEIFKNDTLWSLASRFKDSAHTMNQVMLALQRSNPRAFGDNNINYLKIGAVIRAPDADELNLLSRQEAHAQVLEQNGLWDDYVARVTGTTSSAMADDGGSAGAADTDETEATSDLSLLAPGDGVSDSAGSQGNGEDANQLMKQLAFAEEELEAARIDNKDLESKISDLEARLSKFEELQKMVEIEDDSLAQLQADQIEDQTTSSEVAVPDTVSTDEDDLLEDLLADEAAAEVAISDTVDESASLTDSITDPNATPEPDLMEDDTIGEEDSSVTPEPVGGMGQKTGTFLDDLLPQEVLDLIPMDFFANIDELLPSIDSIIQDPIMLGALGGIVVLLIILMLYRRRNRDNDDDDEFEDDAGISVKDPDGFDFDDEFTPIGLVEDDAEAVDTNINIPDEADLIEDTQSALADEDDFMATAAITQADVEEVSTPAASTTDQDDVLDEVDVYLAYGLYDNAEELLNQNLESSPDRADYRSKLLDTYFATKNTEEFIKHAETLKSMGGVADSYWDRVQVMGYELAPDNGLFSGAKDSTMTSADLGITKPDTADFDLGAEDDDDTNFSITDFNLGEEDANELSETQTVAPQSVDHQVQATALIDELPELAAEDETAADLDFAFDAKDDDQDSDGDAMDFELPDELDLGDSDEAEEAVDPIERTDVFKVAEDLTDLTDLGDLDDLDDLDEANMTGEIESTAVLGSVDFDVEEPAEPELDDSADDFNVEATAIVGTVDFPAAMDDDIDLGLDDTSEQPHLGTADDDELSMDLGGDDLDAGDELAMDFDDSLAMDVDLAVDDESRKTDTYAPGDFDDPEELSAEGVDLDDIEGLMLPDDVDEVSTKLDLARAFIDMGDAEGARGSLNEVVAEGNDDQKAEAQALLGQI